MIGLFVITIEAIIELIKKTPQYKWCARKLKNIKRGIQYFKHGYSSPDYDFAYLHGDILFKLKRIEKYILSSEICVHDALTRKSLRRCIVLFEKLRDDQSFSKYIKQSEWDDMGGELNATYTPEIRLGFELGREYDDYLQKTAYMLISKYEMYWWD